MTHHDAELDAAGNAKPSRERSSEKIDGVAAWCDALCAWSGTEAPEEEFYSFYETDAWKPRVTRSLAAYG